MISKIFTNKEEFEIATVAPYLDNEKIDFLIAHFNKKITIRLLIDFHILL